MNDGIFSHKPIFALYQKYSWNKLRRAQAQNELFCHRFHQHFSEGDDNNGASRRSLPRLVYKLTNCILTVSTPHPFDIISTSARNYCDTDAHRALTK